MFKIHKLSNSELISKFTTLEKLVKYHFRPTIKLYNSKKELVLWSVFFIADATKIPYKKYRRCYLELNDKFTSDLFLDEIEDEEYVPYYNDFIFDRNNSKDSIHSTVKTFICTLYPIKLFPPIYYFENVNDNFKFFFLEERKDKELILKHFNKIFPFKDIINNRWLMNYYLIPENIRKDKDFIEKIKEYKIVDYVPEALENREYWLCKLLGDYNPPTEQEQIDDFHTLLDNFIKNTEFNNIARLPDGNILLHTGKDKNVLENFVKKKD